MAKGINLELVKSPEDLGLLRRAWEHERVAFVPTMGALHEGHLSLVRQAKGLADKVLVSIFVNPLQFGPQEDLAKYPRTLDDDLILLRAAGADAAFLPATSTFYPAGFQTYVNNREMSLGLCGKVRPGHFDGVLTVVLKLLNLVRPQVALFGKKDYQQWRLIETMVRDLSLPVAIIGASTVREQDGVAMSSRNRYLSPALRAKAALIYRGLIAAKAAYALGSRDPEQLKVAFREVLAKEPDFEIQYVEVVTQEELRTPEPGGSEALVMIIACFLGGVRLIDNLELGTSA